MHVLQVGCGALGQLIAEATLAHGHALTIVRRSDKPVPAGAQRLQANVASGEGLSSLRQLRPDILLYCLAPGAEQSYQQAYFDGLQQVLQHLDTQALRHVFFVSSTRVYGQQDGVEIGDDTPALPADIEGHILLRAEQLLDHLPCSATVLRLSGIYGPARRYLLQMAQTPARWPEQAQWTNRIHEQDVVGVVMHLYARLAAGLPLARHYVVTDQLPVLQHVVLQWIAEQMQWPVPGLPPLQPQSGKRLQNQRLIETGYVFQYPDYRAGYGEILAMLQAADE